MRLMLGWSSIWGQSGDRRDTHGMAAAQLLQQELDGGQLGHPGSLHSFWWSVQGQGAEQELCETQASRLFPLLPARGALASCPEAAGHRPAVERRAAAVVRTGLGMCWLDRAGRSCSTSSAHSRAAVGAPLPSWGAVFPPRTAPPGASPRAVSTGPPGCTARQGLPKECADPELLQRPGAAEREEKQPECPLLPSLRAEAGAGRALPRGARHSGRTKPCRGPGRRRCSALPWDVAPRLTGK